MAGLWTWDPATDAVTWSGSVAELHGVPAPATTYSEMLAAVHRGDRDSVDLTWRQLAEQGGEGGQVYRGLSGTLLTAQAQRVELGGRLMLVGVVRLVSRPTRDERRFRDLFRQFPVGLAIFDDHG